MPPADRCAQLQQTAIDHAQVESAAQIDGVCRVNGVASPVAGSVIRFTVYLPAPDRWSGRYYQIGNGGFAGTIHAPTLEEGAARGDAIGATDTGHSGTGFDASWAATNPIALTDYGSRSIKTTSDAARILVASYYGKRAEHRYFMGCSNGGRMALMAAARWPEDWDGVIAGAPANPWVRQMGIFEKIQHRLRSENANWLDRADLETAASWATASCHMPDPVGEIRFRPDKCRLDWSRLTCSGQGKDGCISATKVASLKQIADAGYPIAALDVDDWQRWITNEDPEANSQNLFATQYRTNLLRRRSPAMLSRELDVKPSELARFRKKGGKILSYFGWSDAVISPALGLKWYSDVTERIGGKSAIKDFYRLFMIPGMQHCQGGKGAVNFGQSLSAPSLNQNPQFDIRASLENWVERKKAPDILRAASADFKQQTAIRPQF